MKKYMVIYQNVYDDIFHKFENALTLLRPMEYSIKLYAIKSGWSIVYIEGSQVIILKNAFLSLKIDFILANREYPDEMLHYAAFQLGLHCCQSTPLEFSCLKWVNIITRPLNLRR